MQSSTAQSPLSPFSLSGNQDGFQLDDTISPLSSSKKEMRDGEDGFDPTPSNSTPSIPSMDQISPLPLQPDSPSLIPTNRIPSLSDSNLDRHNDMNEAINHFSRSTSPSPLHPDPNLNQNHYPNSKPSTSTSKRKLTSTTSSHHHQDSIPHHARFVTASAILSRSGAIYPIPNRFESQNQQGTPSNSLFGGNWNVNWSGIGNQSQHDRELEGTTDDQGQDLHIPSSNQDQLGSGLRRKSSDGKRSGMERSRSLSKKPKSKGRGTSNGSALEAFSALLLHKETKGKVSSLSFTKDHNESDEEDEEESSTLENSRPTSTLNSRRSKKFNKPKELNLSRASSSTSSYTVGSLTDWVSNDWLEKVRLAGATRLGLMLPHQNDFSRRRRKEKGTPLTIAERRAKKLGLETPLTGTSKFLDQSFRFCRVGTRYGEPVYQLEKPPKVREKERDGKSDKAKGRILIDGFEMNETGESVEKEGNNSMILEKEKEEKEKGSSSETYDQMQFNPRSTLPPNTRLLLKRSRKDSPGIENGSQQFSNSSFGIGSAQISLDLPEAPPSPLGMPGAWSGSSSWSWSFRNGTNPNSNSRFQEDFAMEGALLLPPPLLDDGSDRNSFEGLLGIKRQREMEKKRKELERLRARNRPDHKVGMFTAMTNFVKAAHAAEKSAKNSKLKQKLQSDRPGLKDRSFTEPIQSRRRGSLSKLELRNEMDLDADLDFESKTPIYATHQESESSKSNHNLVSSLNSHDHLGGISSSPMARRTSASSREDKKPRRRFNTSSAVSSSSTSSSEEEGEREALESLDKVSEELSSSFSSLGDLPRAPRLLPVQLSVPPSPSTPLIGVGSGSSSSSRRSSISDYISSRTSNDISIAPRTPRLGPTLMSLPPSPWVHSSSQSPPSTAAYHFHLNTTSVNGPPGTPKLIPTHLEVLPSPFPTPSVSNHRSSFSFTQPSSLRMTNLIDDSIKPKRRSTSSSSASSSSSTKSRSPRSSFQFDSIPSAPMVLSPTQLAADAKPIPSELLTQSLPSTPTNDSNSIFGSNGRRKGKNLLKGSHPAMNSPGRLTPASMLADLSQNDQVVSSPILTSPPPAPRLGPRPPEFQPLSPIMAPINRRRSLKHNGENGSLPNQNRKSSSTSVRSNSQSSSSPRSARQRSFLIWFLVGDLWLDTRSKLNINSTKSGYLGGIAGFTFHFLNFVIFILAHLLAFIYELSETFSLTFWFLRWIVLNLTGRTVLSRCLIEAHALISNEWKTVSLEDHENRGNHEKRIGNEILKKPKGLTKFQVLRGLAELAALQNVTRERYLSEGAGLIKLEGWRKEKRRRAKDGSRRSQSQSFELEKTKLRPVDENIPQRGESYNSLDSLDSKDDEEEEGEEVTSSSSDEDEGDIVVTNQGQDILELAKTPRIHPVHGSGMRPSMNGRNPSGYFAENVPLDQKKREKRGIHFGQDPTWSEDPRLLMKTIKWASRLAISAYGLHVHIVDLPPTFTPSGERFSRQTFAHLSRLNAEDVLHADIQTLDSEAAYTPTFYVVRDYARKVVVVAVRGTQSFSDIIVDLEMQTDRVDLRDIGGISSDSDEPLLCHAGILRAARALVARDSTLLDTLQAALEENEDFGICLTGHSLGGSVAAVAALLLSEYNTEGIQDGNTSKGRWLTSSSSGLPSKRPIRAITFAPPATVSAALAQRASLGIVPLVTTAVLGSDIIPRAGHGQARELRRVLGALSRVRRRHESAFTSSSPSESEDDARVHIIKSWWDWRSICMAVKPDAVMLHRKDRIEEQLWKLRCDVEADLYAAVKSRHDESSDSKQNVGRRSTSSSSSSSSASTSFSNSRSRIPPSPWVGPQQRAKAPLHQLATRRQAIDAATLRSEAAQGVLPVLFPAGRSIWISGSEIYVITSPLAFFSLPDLHPSMFAEHFPSAYESAFEDLPI